MNNKEFKSGMKTEKIFVHVTGVESSRSNPEERLNRFIGDALIAVFQRDFKEIVETCSWVQAVSIVQKAYNRIRHKSTNVIPFAWICSYFDTVEGEIWEACKENLKPSYQNNKKMRFEQPEYKAGDLVFWYRKNLRTLQPKKEGPFTIINVGERGNLL